MSDSNDLAELSKIISESSKVINDHLTQRNVNLSFDVEDHDPALLALSSPPSYEQARIAAINAASRAVELLSGTEGCIFGLWSKYTAAAALRIAVKHRFARAVPEGSSITYAEVSRIVELDESIVHRVMETLMTYSIFRKAGPGRVCHNRLSHDLGYNENWDSAAAMISDETLVSTCHLSDALDKWGPPQKANQLGFNSGADSPLTFWEYCEKNKERGEHFSRFMRCMATTKLGGIDAVIRAVNWKEFGDGIVVDVGGGLGQVSMKIAEQSPTLEFIVQDFEAVCQQGQRDLPQEYQGRITFQPHNFFDAQKPIQGQRTVFLLKSILHDWPDEDARRIIQAISPTMKAGDRIILLEHILSEPQEGAPPLEKLGRTRDLTMMALLNGKERTAAQFREVLKLADPRLDIIDTISFPDGLYGAVIIARKDLQERDSEGYMKRSSSKL